jgi:anthranilate phosphoribosyltransferase
MFATLLEKLQQRQDLAVGEAAGAMDAIVRGEATPAQVGALLMALRLKGEKPAEIVGFAQVMRAHAVPLPHAGAALFDTCGTGGDGAGTFNVSSAVALVLAAAGVPVAKHGNRSVSSRCGSADVFEALGVNVMAAPSVVARSIEQVGIGFLFAPTFHPSMRHAAAARKELGVRTAFNLLGPLTNPAGATRQLVGVPRPELTELVARALALLGSERAWVVHGADGIDEISTAGYTKVTECRRGLVHTFFVHPSDFGIPKAPLSGVAGGDAAHNADLLRRVLGGERGPTRDITLLNAAAALLVAERVASVRDGLALAAGVIDSGAAAEVLRGLVEVSHGEAAA